MRKYVDNSKADKARRRGLVVVGKVASKRIAKAICKKHYGLEIYGTYLDGVTEIGVSAEKNERYLPFYADLVAKGVA